MAAESCPRATPAASVHFAVSFDQNRLSAFGRCRPIGPLMRTAALGRNVPVAEHLRSAPTIEKPYLLSACGFSDGERETAEHDGPTGDRRQGQMLAKHGRAGEDTDDRHQKRKRRNLINAITLHESVPDRVGDDVSAYSEDQHRDPDVESRRPQGLELTPFEQ